MVTSLSQLSHDDLCVFSDRPVPKPEQIQVSVSKSRVALPAILRADSFHRGYVLGFDPSPKLRFGLTIENPLDVCWRSIVGEP